MFKFMTEGPGSKTIKMNYNIHLVDLRNHGQSEWHKEMSYFPHMVDDLHDYIETHCGPNKNIVLVGHSMGGKAAISFACKYPQKVKGIISIDAPPQNRN